MHPAEPDNTAEVNERIRLWRDVDFPKRPDFPGDPRNWETARYGAASLSPLGERLLGKTQW